MTDPSTHALLAFYSLAGLANPEEEARIWRAFITEIDGRCRIYFSTEGVNGQMSVSRDVLEQMMEWLKSRPLCEKVVCKIDDWHDHAFPRIQIKLKPRLVALGERVDFSKRAESISPQAFKQLLEGEEKPLIVDVRNRYETEVGHFEGALLPPCETFRDFIPFAKELVAQEGKERLYALCCTGGIRCEYFSALLASLGATRSVQLEGGLIQYGHEIGSDHFLGSLFVFDDRMTVPLDPKESLPAVSSCHACSAPSDRYYNCANRHCNELFLACASCLHQLEGCCSSLCQTQGELRPLDEGRPFRKWHHYREKSSR